MLNGPPRTVGSPCAWAEVFPLTPRVIYLTGEPPRTTKLRLRLWVTALHILRLRRIAPRDDLVKGPILQCIPNYCGVGRAYRTRRNCLGYVGNTYFQD